MPRGSTLFSSLFDEIDLPVATRQRKGRSDELNASRNECLLARYYFYGKFTGLRVSIVYSKLSTEFYLSERTIADIIQEERPILIKIREQKPALTWFKKEWPHLVWSY